MPSKEVQERIDKKRADRRERAGARGDMNLRERLLAAHKAERARLNGKSKRWEELIARIPVQVAVRGAEVGVWKGATARQVLEKRPLTTHVMIDTWTAPSPDSEYYQSAGSTQKRDQSVFNEAYELVLSLSKKFKERAPVMRMESALAAKETSNHSLDYVFIDAEHTYNGVKRDIALWREKVKHGGWIGGHDYENEPNFPGVKKAVDEAFPGGVEKGADHTWFVRLLQ